MGTYSYLSFWRFMGDFQQNSEEHSQFTLWSHGAAVMVGLALGLISPQLGKLPMYALWFGVLLGWTTISPRRQPAST